MDVATPRRRLLRRVIWILLGSFFILNLLAYHHADAFFHYAAGGEERTPPPEELGWTDKLKVLVSGIVVPKPSAHGTPADVGLAYRDLVVSGRDGVDLAAWFMSSHRPDIVILFHGYNSERSGLLPEARNFQRLGLNVLMVDFPGHGVSAGHSTTLGIREAEDVAAVLEWTRAKWPGRRIFLYGHSMGGAAVMRAMALNGARPDAAIVESVFDTLLGAIRHRFHLLRAPSFPAADLLLFWGSVQLGINGFAHDVQEYAGRVDVPVMVIHGRRDNRADWRAGKAVHDRLAGPSAWLLVEEAGHVNPCLADPEGWHKAVWAFIDRQW